MLLQTADGLELSAKGQHWRSAGLTGLVRAEGEHRERYFMSIVWCAVEIQVVCQYAHCLWTGFRCSCCVLHAHLLLITADRQTDTHTHTLQGYILCVSVTDCYILCVSVTDRYILCVSVTDRYILCASVTDRYILCVSVTDRCFGLLHWPLSPLPHTAVCDATIFLHILLFYLF
jgi:hypothetical protein